MFYLYSDFDLKTYSTYWCELYFIIFWTFWLQLAKHSAVLLMKENVCATDRVDKMNPKYVFHNTEVTRFFKAHRSKKTTILLQTL